ncbi:MAG: PD-(D/E)XK nuclease family protein, partial [Candidatus Hodarchaeota archaeon]
MLIYDRLRTRGLNFKGRIFCPYDSSFQQQGLCPDSNHPHQLLASQRTDEAINTWGHHLFPLIKEAEVKLKGIRDMPNYREGVSRCNYYGVTGIVDVISSVNIHEAPSGNLILHYINQNSELQKILSNLNSTDFEIVIDYKGTRRPATSDSEWEYHEWQIYTYAWLRMRQPNANNVVAGIIFYINELAPSLEDLLQLKDNVQNNVTDIMPQGRDLTAIQNCNRNNPTPQLTQAYRENRSIKLIPITKQKINNSLQQFDNVVNNIEDSVLSEIRGNIIQNSWCAKAVKRNCTACDFKTFCQMANTNTSNSGGPYTPTVP